MKLKSDWHVHDHYDQTAKKKKMIFGQLGSTVFGDAFGAMNGGKRQLQLIVLWVEN